MKNEKEIARIEAVMIKKDSEVHSTKMTIKGIDTDVFHLLSDIVSYLIGDLGLSKEMLMEYMKGFEKGLAKSESGE